MGAERPAAAADRRRADVAAGAALTTSRSPWPEWDPDEVAFWSGAGISIDSPTDGPAGMSLTRRALHHYLPEGTAEDLVRLYGGLAIENQAARPRLETVLDALVEVYGVEVLTDVLSDLVAPAPNRHHHVLARHLALGGSHLTTNFDTCIERSPGCPDRPHRMIHVHGSLGPGSPITELGARISLLENGLPPSVRSAVDAVLDDARLRCLVFIGYSGSDFFDVTPYLLERGPALRRLTVIWLDHAATPLRPHPAPDRLAPDLFRRLVATGIPVQAWQGTLDDLFPVLGAGWWQGGAPPPPTDPGGRTPDWHPQGDRPVTSRRAAAVALHSRLGYRAGVRCSFAQSRPRTAADWDRLADAWWGAGRYRRALDAWQHAYAGQTPQDQARLAERVGAVAWIRGDYRRAVRVLRAGLSRWSEDDRVEPQTRAQLAETYARVLLHMRRFPDARLFAGRRRRAEAARLLDRAGAELAGRAGTAMRARLAGVSADLAGRPDPAAAAHVESFSQADALNGWLNFQHSMLRRRVEHAAAGPAPTRADYELLRTRQRLLGAEADAARVPLLPGAEAHFTVRDVVTDLRAVDLTRWHRSRLVAGFTVLRLRRRALSGAARRGSRG